MASKWVRTKFLGKGSYGSVFRAECALPSLANSPKIVAVKSSLQSFSWSLSVEKAVLCELRGCNEIVRCFEDEDFNSTESGKRFYNIVLEYADGGTLGQLLKSRGGWIQEYEASCYAGMLLKGLAHVHDKGYVHCDIKPDNVLVFNVPSGDVVKYNLKLADFGLAKKSGGISCDAGQEFKHRGTLLYSSPESVVFGVHEAAMDVWSLGCTVVEMLLGEGGLWNRFIDADVQSLSEMIADYEEAWLILLLPKFDYLSVNAKDFVRRCLTKNVEERWTAQQLLNHPFITHCTQNVFNLSEEQLSHAKMMNYESGTRHTPFNSPLRSSLISLGFV